MRTTMQRKKCVYIALTSLLFLCLYFVLGVNWTYLLPLSDLHVTISESSKKELQLLVNSGQSEKVQKVGYNIVNSRSLGAIRTLPDTRHESCLSLSDSNHVKKYKLPTISVVITMDHAERSVLVRNILSILINAEPLTIYDIVIVLDGIVDSKLENYLKNIPRIKIIKNDQSKGRAMSRMQGVSATKGDIIVFVDCLSEMNTSWLLPLIIKLMESPRSIVSPVEDVIDRMTFKYYSLVELYWLGFDWSLQPQLEQYSPSYVVYSQPPPSFRSPLMSGSVFAVRREFFFWLGQYDPSYWAHSMEDIELSLKTWLCGGQIEIVPCSRIGVIKTKYSDSHSSFNNYLRSAKRIAEVWLDEYKRFFYAIRPSARMQPTADISSMRKLKEKRKCRSFQWFLTNIYPQLQPLVTDEIAFGAIRQGDNCLDLDPGQLPLIAKLRLCENEKNSQEWSWRKTGNIVSNGMCLTSDLINMRAFVLANFCKEQDNNQMWYRHEEKIVHLDTNLCLDSQQASTGLIITDCIKGRPSQSWMISTEYEPDPPG